MPEIALITAGLALCLGVAALLLDRATSIRLERVAESTREISSHGASLEASVGKITTELPESRVIEMEGTCRALKEQYDSVVGAFEKHRLQCHKSIQRFDQIMRRDERAAKVITAAQEAEGEGLETEPADDAEAVPMTQEGDRSFLESANATLEKVAGPDRTADQVAAILRDRNPNGSWDDRRRAMQREYHANRGGGATVESHPRGRRAT